MLRLFKKKNHYNTMYVPEIVTIKVCMLGLFFYYKQLLYPWTTRL